MADPEATPVQGHPPAERWQDLLHGAVDLYVHAEPDLVPRHGDDVDLGRQLVSWGFAAGVHRNHHSPTAERSALVRRLTGAPLVGAILANQAAGGLDPVPVDLALRHGARWVGLPTLSARHFRSTMAARGALTPVLGFGSAELELLDSSGAIRPQVLDILELAGAAAVPLNLGYASATECVAVARRAAEQGLTLVVTNPLSVMALSTGEAAELLDATGAFLEVTAYSLHPSNASHRLAPQLFRLMRSIGVQRCVLSSDGGIATAPASDILLAMACDVLSGAGFTEAELRTLIQGNPRRVLAI
ncbi:DUF6282 family protein [Blastococcus sp. URHD0036]|uniref:DUF6282 family protein n=1 Tax=Blastococcus sp. URHD0036 TaxID=1380356 RepID=UPI0004960E79|nr:DUF6282 family protein [Blastococcus sp. URHD0036]